MHFFAPYDIPPLPKQVVFVLDTSGSMYDRKILQLKEAMSKILGELKENDLFNIVEFNSNVRIWDLNRNATVDFPELGDSWYSGESNKSLNVSKFFVITFCFNHALFCLYQIICECTWHTYLSKNHLIGYVEFFPDLNICKNKQKRTYLKIMLVTLSEFEKP